MKIFNTNQIPGVILNAATILIVAILLWVNQAWAKPEQISRNSSPSTGVLSYQGTLMDSSGNPVSSNFNIRFRIYNSPSTSTYLWEEIRSGENSVPVQNGLFTVMLGSLNPIPMQVWDETELFLGVKVGTDAEMTPRELINTIPVAEMALTVPDGAIGTSQLENHLCCGSTNSDGTGWENHYAFAVTIPIDTSECSFSSTPMYFTSLVGAGSHYDTTGATSIYSPTPTDFRVYVKDPQGDEITPAFADEMDWHIEWCGVEK